MHKKMGAQKHATVRIRTCNNNIHHPTHGRLSAKESRDVDNVILEMRGRITRESITLKTAFKVNRAVFFCDFVHYK